MTEKFHPQDSKPAFVDEFRQTFTGEEALERIRQRTAPETITINPAFKSSDIIHAAAA